MSALSARCKKGATKNSEKDHFSLDTVKKFQIQTQEAKKRSEIQDSICTVVKWAALQAEKVLNQTPFIPDWLPVCDKL